MMEIELQTVIDNINVLSELAKKEIPAKAAFIIARILGQITDEYNTYQTSRRQLIEKYGEKDENGNLKTNEDGNAFIRKEDINKFNEELKALVSTKVTILGENIPLSSLENLNFTPGQMYVLAPFINENM